MTELDIDELLLEARERRKEKLYLNFCQLQHLPSLFDQSFDGLTELGLFRCNLSVLSESVCCILIIQNPSLKFIVISSPSQLHSLTLFLRHSPIFFISPSSR
jgi:hypothetical protein